jgi:predicted component of type VI protein secretion system
MFMRVQSLQMLQQGLLERLEAARRFQHHYPYGVIEAEVASDELTGGKLRFNRLRAVLPNGLEVVVPEECDLQALPVREEISKSRTGEVVVLLGVPDYLATGQNTFPIGQIPNRQVNLRFIPWPEQRVDENSGDNKQSIYVRTLNTRLLFEHESRAGLECLPLVKVRKASIGTGKDFRVELVPNFVPPCLFLPTPELAAGSGAAGSNGGTDLSLPHRLAEQVNLAVQAVERARRELGARMQGQAFGSGALKGSQFQDWIRLLALARHAARLLTLQQSSHTTPFEMFLGLYEALREMESSKPRRGAAGRAQQDARLEYEHGDVYAVFTKLWARLKPALEDVIKVECYEAPFEADPSSANRVRAELREEFFGEDVLAWLLSVRAPQLAESDLTRLVQDRIRFELTTPGLIDYGNGGLQLRRKPNPPAGLDEAPDLFYYQVELSNNAILQELWAQVRETRQLAINKINPNLNLEEATFTFYAILKPKTDNPD